MNSLKILLNPKSGCNLRNHEEDGSQLMIRYLHSLFKQSGKAYRTLSKVFALPSKKSIMDLLKKIPFESGINNIIFEHLKTTMRKLNNKLDRYCSVIFDEVSISASLQFIESKDLGHHE